MSTIFEMHDVAGEPVHELEGSTDMAAWVPLASVRELDLAPLTERGLALWRQRSCSTAALTARAMAVRDRYARFETARFGREWTTTELLAGFMTDVGDLSRLVLAATGVREADDVEAKLAHELADCLWSVLVLGDRLGIDVGAAFASTMDDLERFLDDAT
jgi:NTP pyrophosphatase (non-canonical NTP hydrolase)